MNIVTSPPGNSGFSAENPVPGNLLNGIVPGTQSFDSVLGQSTTNGQGEPSITHLTVATEGVGLGELKSPGPAPGALTGSGISVNPNSSRVLNGIATEILDGQAASGALVESSSGLSAISDNPGPSIGDLLLGDLLQANRVAELMVMAPTIPWLVPVTPTIETASPGSEALSIEARTQSAPEGANQISIKGVAAVSSHGITVDSVGQIASSPLNSFSSTTQVPKGQVTANPKTPSQIVGDPTLPESVPQNVGANDTKRPAIRKPTDTSVDSGFIAEIVQPPNSPEIIGVMTDAGKMLQSGTKVKEAKAALSTPGGTLLQGTPSANKEGRTARELRSQMGFGKWAAEGTDPLKSLNSAVSKISQSGDLPLTHGIAIPLSGRPDSTASPVGNAQSSVLKLPISSKAGPTPTPRPLSAETLKDLKVVAEGAIPLPSGGVIEIITSVPTISAEQIKSATLQSNALVAKQVLRSDEERMVQKNASRQSSADDISTLEIPIDSSNGNSSTAHFSSGASVDFLAERGASKAREASNVKMGSSDIKPTKQSEEQFPQLVSRKSNGVVDLPAVKSATDRWESIGLRAKPVLLQATFNPQSQSSATAPVWPSEKGLGPNRSVSFPLPGSAIHRSSSESQSPLILSTGSNMLEGDGHFVPGAPVAEPDGTFNPGEIPGSMERFDQKSSNGTGISPNRLNSADANAVNLQQQRNRGENESEVQRVPSSEEFLAEGRGPTEISPSGIMSTEDGIISNNEGGADSAGSTGLSSESHSEMSRNPSEHPLGPRREGQRMGRQINSGTGDAQQASDMAVSAKFNSESEASGKNLPVGSRIDSAATVRGQDLPPVASERNSVESVQGSLLLVAGQGSSRGFIRGAESSHALVEGRSSLNQNLTEGMWTAVESFRSQGGEDWVVRLRPDSENAVQLRMKLQDNQLVIHAKLESGNVDLVAAKWNELQSVLGERGIQLKPLETDFGNLNGNQYQGTSGFASNDQESRNARTDQMPWPESERPTFPHGKTKPESKEPRRPNQMLETWA